MLRLAYFYKKGGECAFAADARSRGNPAKAAVHRTVKPKNAATCLTAAVSPDFRISGSQPKSVFGQLKPFSDEHGRYSALSNWPFTAARIA